MYIKRIDIENFKAISKLNLQLKPGVNILIGDNGVGKTSILDAIQNAIERECWVMNYPYGNISDDVLDYIRKTGCVLGVSVMAETARLGIGNSLILPRYDANDVYPKGYKM